MEIEMLNLINRMKKFSANSVTPYPLAISRADGVYVYDFKNRPYIDMASGIAVANFGHKHPRIVKALITQVNKIAALSRLFYNEPISLLLEKACKLTHMDQGLPMSSGAEAVETAIKVARKWGYLKKQIPQDKAEIILCKDNFHGRTVTVISMSSNKKYQDNFGPLTPGFKLVPFNDTAALEATITDNTAAFIVEPIQGEAGIIIPSTDYLKACETICKKKNVLLIVDEIQAGLGRTGKFLASHHENIQPDGIILGKALGGGLVPISLFLAKKHLMNVIQPGDHGSTFSGNPLASYVAYEALNTLIEEGLIQNSADIGAYFTAALKKLSSPIIREVRGKGLFIAIEINTEIITPRLLCEKLLENGLLSIDTRNQSIRFLPPLIINKQQIDNAIDIISKTLHEITRH